MLGDVVPEVGRARTVTSAIDGFAPGAPKRDSDQGGDREAQEEPAEHVGRKAGAQVHRGERHEEDHEREDPTEGTHEVRGEPERQCSDGGDVRDRIGRTVTDSDVDAKAVDVVSPEDLVQEHGEAPGSGPGQRTVPRHARPDGPATARR